jgi:predicted dehydrogenase
MNLLFIGIGRICQRHIRNIKSKYKNLKVFYIKGKHSNLIITESKSQKGDVISKYGLKPISFNDINKKVKIDAAFICLPSHLHSKFFKILVEKKVNIFLEKPGGINQLDIKLLKDCEKKIKKNNLKVMVGYHLRFHPMLSNLKKLIVTNKVGRILNVLVENGEHIADYRPFEKYWKKYHSKKKEGGGVLLNQIHDIDYFLELFKNYKFNLINTFSSKISKLKITAEDTLSSNFLVSNLKEKFLLTLLFNSYERPQKRTIKIIGAKGKIFADLQKGEIEIFNFNIHDNGILKSKKVYRRLLKNKINRKNLFKNEVFYFINSIKINRPIDKRYGLERSIKTLSVGLKLKN